MRAFVLLLLSLPAFSDPFADYWFSGQAEVSVYELEQSRYGELRKGTATLIYVTEPFSRKKHVKLDRPEIAGDDKVSVLKLNTVKKYTTGIYPYSVMTSAFGRISDGQLLKTTTSIQEWCGQIFTQVNLANQNTYKIAGFSYFESEGDARTTVKKALLEEQVWTGLRLHPGNIPTGTIDFLPSQEFWRFYHAEPRSVKAEIMQVTQNKETTVTIHHKQPVKRTLSITFEEAFPHAILSWTESIQRDDKESVSRATLKTRHQNTYWNMNSNRFSPLRMEYGLE